MINNSVLVYQKDRGFTLHDDVIDESDNLLRVEGTGICGTDRHILEHRIAVPDTIVLGHEVIGQVRSLPNPQALLCDDELRVDDRVAIMPGVPCGICETCVRPGCGCSNRRFYGLNVRHQRGQAFGGFSDYMNLMPGTRVYKIPRAMSTERAVSAEVLGACLRAVKKALDERFSAGRRVLVQGSGVIGIATALLAQLYGAEVVITDVHKHRLDFARREFALETVHVDSNEDGTLAAKLHAEFHGFVPEVIIECAGTLTAMRQALPVLTKRGRLVVLGNYADMGSIDINPSLICRNDLQILGTAETFPEDFRDAIRILERHTEIQFEKLVTHSFALQEYERALAAFHSYQGIKIIFTPSQPAR